MKNIYIYIILCTLSFSLAKFFYSQDHFEVFVEPAKRPLLNKKCNKISSKIVHGNINSNTEDDHEIDLQILFPKHISKKILSSMNSRNLDEARQIILNYLVKKYKENSTEFQKKKIDNTRLSLAQEKILDENFEEAIAIYSEILESNSENRHAIYLLGDLFLRLKKNDLAIKHYEKFLKKTPSDKFILDSLKSIYMKTGKLQEGLAFLKTIKNDDNISPFENYIIGDSIIYDYNHATRM